MNEKVNTDSNMEAERAAGSWKGERFIEMWACPVPRPECGGTWGLGSRDFRAGARFSLFPLGGIGVVSTIDGFDGISFTVGSQRYACPGVQPEDISRAVRVMAARPQIPVIRILEAGKFFRGGSGLMEQWQGERSGNSSEVFGAVRGRLETAVLKGADGGDVIIAGMYSPSSRSYRFVEEAAAEECCMPTESYEETKKKLAGVMEQVEKDKEDWEVR